MTTYVEVNDEGEARSAAQRLVALGGQLNDGSAPPTVEWGDDKFGDQMREGYYEVVDQGLSVAALALWEKQKLGDRLNELGEGLDAVVNLVTIQDVMSRIDIDRVEPPVL